jgi:hypothetical protein
LMEWTIYNFVKHFDTYQQFTLMNRT